MICGSQQACGKKLTMVSRRTLLLLTLALTAVPTLAPAQTFTTLYTFQGPPDGSDPHGKLIRDPAGNLYGTTVSGGKFCNNVGCGTAFKIDPIGREAVLHSFRRLDGVAPDSALVVDPSGNLYGCARTGGAFASGTIFKLSPLGAIRVLHTFNPTNHDAATPTGLVRDHAGNLYGTTEAGGAFHLGTIFKIDPDGNESILVSFDGSNGAAPKGGLIMDGSGNLYGTTFQGGTLNAGTVFVSDTSGNVTVLYSFADAGDGGFPFAGVVKDFAGNLYGTTGSGGRFNAGTVFKLDAAGNETVLHSFRPNLGDGKSPIGGVVIDDNGNLFGTTEYGGVSGLGTVYKVDPQGNESIIHSFAGGAEGQQPLAGLVMDGAGNLYGTTSGLTGNGTVFKISPP